MTSSAPESRVNAPVTEAESISGTVTTAAAITDPAAPSNRIIKPRDFIAFFYLSNETWRGPGYSAAVVTITSRTKLGYAWQLEVRRSDKVAKSR
jgi:hypothetical protein